MPPSAMRTLKAKSPIQNLINNMFFKLKLRFSLIVTLMEGMNAVICYNYHYYLQFD